MCAGTSPFDPSPSDPSPACAPSSGVARARTEGEAELSFTRSEDGQTRLAHLYQRAPLRALFPASAEPGLATAVLVTTTGGLVGGDRLDVRVTAGAGAAVQVTPQAAEKVYRSLGADCRLSLDLRAGDDAWLEWLPQETILFESARLDRTTRIDCAPGARVLAGEMLVFGRRARGERFTRGRIRDAWEIRREGRLVWADALLLDSDLARVLASTACLAGAAAVASAVYVAGSGLSDALALARDLTSHAASDMAAAATCVAGVLVVRWLSRDASALRAAFGRFWAAFRHRIGGRAEGLPRAWSV